MSLFLTKIYSLLLPSILKGNRHCSNIIFMTLILALKEDILEFEISLDFVVSSRPV